MSLQIKTPCHANWDQMSPTNQGRHCNACSKTVFDFTQYSEQQILEVLAGTTGEVCGRLHQSALLSEPSAQRKSSFWKKGILAVCAFLGIQTSQAQSDMRHSRAFVSPEPPPDFKQSATDTSFKFTLVGGAMHADTGVHSILVNTVLNRHFFTRDDTGVFEFEIPRIWFDSVLRFSFFDKKGRLLGSYQIPIADAWKYYDSRILFSELPEAKIVVDIGSGHGIVMGAITQPYGFLESRYKTSYFYHVAPEIKEAAVPQNNQGKIPVHVSGKVNNGTHDIPGITYVPASPLPEY
jgi:hypothetical protein